MKNGIFSMYFYCSMCAGKLREDTNGNLACGKCQFVNYRNPRPTVTGLIVRKGKLLLTKRRIPPYKGWWDLPGGFVHRGEAPQEAIKREVEEETGLKITIKKFFGLYTGTYPHVFDPCHILTVVYIAESSSATPQARDDVSASSWFSKKELPKRIAFDSNQMIVKDFLRVWN